MIRRVSIFVISMALALLSVSAHALEPGDNPLALSSENGLQAIIVPTGDGSQALVKLTGVDHPIDGVVVLAEVDHRSNDERAYQAELNGKMRSLVVFAPSYWATSDYTAYIPGQEEPHALTVDEERGPSVDSQALVSEYEQQKERGLQAKLARFDREQAVQRQQEALRAIDRSASQVCGDDVLTRVNWTKLDNEQLKNLSISGYCGQVAAEMEHLCRQDDGFKQKVTDISEVDCEFADQLELHRNGEKLVFQTREDAQNQRDAINGFLQNL